MVNAVNKLVENKSTEITFPELRGTIAKYGLTKGEMAKIISNTYQTFSKKLEAESDFSFTDMLKIREFFVNKGENVSIETLFFKWRFTIVNIQARKGEV